MVVQPPDAAADSSIIAAGIPAETKMDVISAACSNTRSVPGTNYYNGSTNDNSVGDGATTFSRNAESGTITLPLDAVRPDAWADSSDSGSDASSFDSDSDNTHLPASAAAGYAYNYEPGTAQQTGSTSVSAAVSPPDEGQRGPATSIPLHGESSGFGRGYSPEMLARFAAAAEARQEAATAVAVAAASGKATDKAWAQWEAHSRGVGSRILDKMGYVRGRGLGSRGTGMAAPIQVQPLRPGAGLGLVPFNKPSAPGTKKKSRGGARARRARAAAEARSRRMGASAEADAEEAAGGAPGLFGFINNLDKVAQAQRSEGVAAKPKPAAVDTRKELATQQQRTAELRSRLGNLEAMAVRNAKDKTIAAQVAKQLATARKELAAAEGSNVASLAGIQAREKERKWAKF